MKRLPVRRVWEEMLGTEFLTRPRLSRVYCKGGTSHPITAKDVVRRRGLVEATRCALSIHMGSVASEAGRGDVRGMGDDALRMLSVRRVLPLAYRGALGDSRPEDPIAVRSTSD
ncbi:MAG TPA: hypothetical protein VJB15_10625 [Rhodothermia bacterium]|nr:hypothetical protein [Rhodothermia bacterium]